MPKPIPIPVKQFTNPAAEEESTVHEVYESIAPHFSQTRSKPWPLIDKFLHSIPPASLGLDSGAGNGKYLPSAIAAGSSMIALDRSRGLLDIAKRHGECVRGDLGAGCWRDGVFDFAISVAAIHHLSTTERRQHSIQVLLRTLSLQPYSPFSRFLLYVWAYEQGDKSKRRMGVLGDNGEEAKIQDVLVPWVMGNIRKSTKGQTGPKDAAETPALEEKVYHRYYHLFEEGELQAITEAAGRSEGFQIVVEGEEPKNCKWLKIRGVGWEADNWWLDGEVGCAK